MKDVYMPYRSLGIIENNPGEYLIVKRRGQNLFSFIGGKESPIDMQMPIKTMIRENMEEAEICGNKIELSEVRTSFTYRGKIFYVFTGKMKKIDPLPGYISHDEDIEYYVWLNLEKIGQLPLTEVDVEVYCWAYNNL